MKNTPLFFALVFWAFRSFGAVDTFGITELYPTVNNGPAWNSAHWNNGIAREFTPWDAFDPTGWSERTGIGTLSVDGRGVMTMSGSQPRWYLRKVDKAFFVNVEMTAYYMRVADSNIFYSGFVMGARSGPTGHGGINCEATTYYGSLRHDGQCIFDKELEHPEETPRNYVRWSSGMGYNRWIGMKYCVYNINDNRHVKLEIYIDTTGGVNGGTWKLINQTADTGGWSTPENCSYPGDFIITTGGGSVFIRNTNVIEERYKWLSVREIDPAGQTGIRHQLSQKTTPGTVAHGPGPLWSSAWTFTFYKRTCSIPVLTRGNSGTLLFHDLKGNLVRSTTVINGSAQLKTGPESLHHAAPGFYIVTAVSMGVVAGRMKLVIP